jgi:DHA1 family bicyclomycin/chloramphenicol resistance-like MFS transporter
MRSPVVETRERIPARLVLIVGTLSAFGPLCLDMYLPALPAIKKHLHTSASLVQLSLTSCLIGMALGQLVFGPLSDRFGRRRPLFAGMATFVLASVACAVAPNIGTLVLFRFLEGIGGAAGIVIAQAVVRDRYEGVTAARFFSLLLLVMGAGPILAPQIGSGLLYIGPWRGIFLTLAVVAALLAFSSSLFLPETLPPERRRSGRVRETLTDMRTVISSRAFLASALACGFALGAIFAYVAGGAFVLENIHGLSPQQFSLVFAINAVGFIGAGQVNGRLVSRYGPAHLMGVGLVGLVVAATVLLVLIVGDIGGLGATLVCLFVLLGTVGLIAPNASALALNDFPESAGSASALLGLIQFATGAGLAPLVGVAGDHDARPMAIVLFACAVIACVVRFGLGRGAVHRGGAIDMHDPVLLATEARELT